MDLILIGLSLITTWLGIPQKITDTIITKIALGPIFGLITGAVSSKFTDIIDKFTDGLLKEEWTFEILGQEFSIPITVIVTAITELLIFTL